ncbi:hypothetical protein SOVF_063830 [Spinacia oleracea]|uniref:Increased DNA methylation 1-like n=1 Tax=Spinacia oleracea TaxID=3562 RepID=A0A9R0IPS9_SPIOL|nr:increased DNA methylation 1-like [Spinacia oleracea]KNA19199.1 hypothetical protein SOVF_063830 [Spinacia oleracea]
MVEGKGCVLALQYISKLENRKLTSSNELKKEELWVSPRKLTSSNELKKEELWVSPKYENAREASNAHTTTDDLCSGVSDSIPVHNEIASNNCLEISSSNNPDNQISTGDVTSESSANSCTEFGDFGTSQITQEIPKPVTTTKRGLKIRFRIRSDDEQRVTEQETLPTKRVGKSLNKDLTSFVTGEKRKRGLENGGKRNDSLHKLLFKKNGVPDGTYLAYCLKGEKILEGYKQGTGIVCSHCDTEISPSQFEAHAGMAVRKKPYQHIHDANGVTLHDIALALALALNDEQHQTKRKKNNSSDIRLTDAKTDCVDSLRSNHNKPIIIKQRTSKKSEVDYGGTCVLCLAHDFSVKVFNDRTVIICDQCEKEYHVGCLREGGHCDLKEVPKTKWFCCNDCDRVSVALKERVTRGSEVIPSSETSKIIRKLLKKKSRVVADNDVQFRILHGKYSLPEHQPLLSRAVSLFRDCFSPITTLTGRDLITMMVHGRSISGQDFGGMYCVFLTVKSVVVSVGLVRILGSQVAELPLVATRKKCQGKGYFQALFSRIEELLRFLKVEKLVLPAAENAISMWVDKFGFRDMSSENLLKYTRFFQLTEFSGTVMLEKQVEQQQMDCSEPFSDSRISENLKLEDMMICEEIEELKKNEKDLINQTMLKF